MTDLKERNYRNKIKRNVFEIEKILDSLPEFLKVYYKSHDWDEFIKIEKQIIDDLGITYSVTFGEFDIVRSNYVYHKFNYKPYHKFIITIYMRYIDIEYYKSERTGELIHNINGYNDFSILHKYIGPGLKNDANGELTIPVEVKEGDCEWFNKYFETNDMTMCSDLTIRNIIVNFLQMFGLQYIEEPIEAECIGSANKNDGCFYEQSV